MKKVSVSILGNNDMYATIDKINKTKASYIHLDVMDDTFVKNSFIKKNEIDRVISSCEKLVDIHFMTYNPLSYIDMISDFSKVFCMTIHYEIKDFLSVINYIKSKNVKVGLAINPETKVSCIYKYLNLVDLVIVMGVHPGYSNQKFILDTREKLKELKTYIKENGLSTKISIDGGVNDKVFDFIKDADIIVSSSFVLNDLSNIEKLESIKNN